MLRPQQNAVRNTIDLSGLWNFQIDPEEIGEAEAWFEGIPHPRQIAVPGSWNEQFTDTDMYLGQAWYQRETYVPSIWRGSRVLIHVGSANYAAQVWVNGQLIGEHFGGHLPFGFDITEHIEWNERNRIGIAVDNELRPDRVPPGNMQGAGMPAGFGGNVPPTSFDFFPYAGIHRPVTLYSVPLIHIDDVTVTTEIDGRDGIVLVQATASDNWTGAGTLELTSETRNRIVELPFVNGEAIATVRVPDARFWSPADPHLYALTVSLLGDEEIADEYHLDIGIRTFVVEGDKLLLNHEPIELRGFGKHEESPAFGRALNMPQMAQDASLMRWLGANSFRTSHYPYAEEAMDLADRLGFLVIDEIPAVGLSFSDGEENIRARLEQCKLQVRELIDRDKNHPSVISWSVANEPIPNNMGSLTGTPEEDPSGEDATGGNAFFEELTEYARSLDGTRPVIIVGVMGGSPSSWMALSDYTAINRYWGWYVLGGMLDEAKEALEAEIDALHEKHGKPLVMTEFGADTIAGRHTVDPQLFSEEYQRECLRLYLDAAEERDWFAGLHVWNFADFRTAQGVSRMGGFNLKGVFTRDRQPKLAAHFLRERWAHLDGDDKAEAHDPDAAPDSLSAVRQER
jgi:beta-glucuronidase